jgi:20S proteasome alpha/beta subunit
MTAILGMNYLDGVLMMADTEETTSMATKSEADKLYRFIFPVGTVILGGAGDAHLIECANQDLHQYFAKGGMQKPDTKATPEEIHSGLNAFAQKFFKETTGQYKGLASDLVPTFEMLIAINYEKRSYLFRWTHNRVVWIPSHQHTSIGSGMIQIHPMLRDVQFAATKESSLFLGVRMMFHAKRIVQAVGGKTEAIALQHDGATHYFGLETTKKVEDLVVNFEQFLNKFVYLAVSNVSPTVAELDKNVEKGFAELSKLLHQYRKTYREILTPQKQKPR